MSRNRQIQSSGHALLLILCISFIPAGYAQHDAASFMAPYETEALGDGLYAFRIGMRRSIFLVGAEGVIATDPLNVEAATIYRQEIAKITDKPVKYVAYSSSFLNHVIGGKIFKDQGATFVAHANCASNLTETPHPDVVMPDVTYTDRHEISVGEQSLELFYFGLSYGNCLSVMIARPANIMLIANLVTPPKAAVPSDPTLANYYLHNLIDFFRSVENLASERGVERVIGSFAAIQEGREGEPQLGPATAAASIIKDQRVFWEEMIGAVQTAFAAGAPARVIPKRIDWTQFSEYAGYDERNLEIMTRRVYSLHRIGR
ncbi:MAG: hypothetical protein OER85_03240 [Gammaproteobacteria bacterium]|nr:hypothetical protein [Gammaproteobacteria bacterium]